MELPQAFLNKMENLLGQEYFALIQSFENQRAQGLRVNPLKISPKALHQLMPIQLTTVPWCTEGFYYPADARPGKHPYHDAGLFYIQEPSAMAAVQALDPQPGENILDLCAAPGGKASHIAGRMQGRGVLIANEPHPTRVKILSQNIERLGVTNAVVTCATPDQLAPRFFKYFDRILVDAPCSGEGMFRKDMDTRGEWSEENVAHCALRQWEILQSAVSMLRPGGRLVYSTCTFSPEENEKIISRLMDEMDFEVILPTICEKFSNGIPEWGNGDPSLAKTIRIWPHKTQGEGHFIAVLRKKGEFLPEHDIMIEVDAPDEYNHFVLDTLIQGPKGRICTFGDQLYIVPLDMMQLDRVKVIRAGLHLGCMKKKRFEPSHALALALKKENVQRVTMLKSNEKNVLQYLRGETLAVDAPNGWNLVCVDGFPLGWGKVSNGILKNHYPKGLRRMGNEE